MKNISSKAIALFASVVLIAIFSASNPAEGVNVSTASQISTLQKQVARLQAQIDVMNSRVQVEYSTATIAFYTLTNGCREPGTAIVNIPITSTILCGMQVMVPTP